MNRISGFTTPQHRYLSNFYLAPVLWGDEITPKQIWPSNEIPYQIAKFTDPAQRASIIDAIDKVQSWQRSSMAKRIGRVYLARPDWDRVKVTVMIDLVFDKFTRNYDLAARLLSTGNAELIEENNWGDTFWGMCNGQGKNVLGRILMGVRMVLQKDFIGNKPVSQAFPTSER